MEHSPRHRIDLELRRLELHKQESAAKSVPYISFILTHVALVLFLVAAFFVDRLIPDRTTTLFVKIALSVIAVLFLASEWIYAIRSSLRWKKNILIFYQLEQEQRIAEEQERQRQYQEAMSVEQLRNRAMHLDLQRLRGREQGQVPYTPHVYTPRSNNFTSEEWPYPSG